MNAYRAVLLFCLAIYPFSALRAQETASGVGETSIRLNQIGFLPAQKKIAIVENRTSGIFSVIDRNTGDTAWKGALKDPVRDPYSGTICSIADFSALATRGTYFLAVSATGHSYPFSIGEQVYAKLAEGVLKAYYFLRCSAPLLPRYAGPWARPEGHPDTLVFVHASAASPKRPEGTVIRSPGGWYDAGDYNKYVVNCGITMGTLLSAYEDFPGHFDRMNTRIPDHDPGVPDLLKEVLWNLRWMMSMQDPDDGGVYHKLTDTAFDKMEMPGSDHARRYVVMKTTTATLDFTAVMAQAARIFRAYKKALPGLADSCLNAAVLAWRWAAEHPRIIYNQDLMNKRYTPRITTGAYGDAHPEDEQFWAAVELSVTTGEVEYRRAIVLHAPRTLSIPSWSNVGMLGIYTLLTHGALIPGGKAGADSLQNRYLRFSENLLHHQNPAYRTVMGGSGHDFVWGSNSVAAAQGIALVRAYRLSKDRRFLSAAESNLDYLLGRNATGYCFVTGFGSLAPVHPHHRPSIADGVRPPIPGLLVGGPNPGQQDHQPYPTRIWDESYADEDQAYASNEIAINWNAPMVYLVNALCVLGQEKNMHETALKICDKEN